MRVFSDFEKEIIQELIAGFKKGNYVNCLNNLFVKKPKLQSEGYYLTNVKFSGASENRVNIYVDEIMLEKDYCSSINSFLIELLELFEYLQENQLITLVPLSTDDGESALALYVRLVVTPFNSDKGRWTDSNDTLYPRTTQANTQRLPRKWPQFTSIRQNAWYC